MDKVGGRKFTIAMIMLVAGVVIDLNTERGLSESLMYLMLGIIGAFSAGNVLSKAAMRNQSASEIPQVDPALIKSVIEEIRVNIDTVDDKVNVVAEQVENNQKRMLAILDIAGKRGE